MTHLPIRPSRKAFPGSAALLLLAACTPGLEPRGTRPTPASIDNILFRIAPQNLAQSVHPQEMAEKVSGNLRGWGYPITAEKDGVHDYSHVMEARIGQVEHRSTPAGFSLSVGNSDPRALEFQKADVLPVDCVLFPALRPKETASLYMDFIADAPLKGLRPDKSGAALADIYINHIATVCFNLLEDLKVKRIPPAQTAPAAGAKESSTTPAWFPEVRIEVREKPADPSPRLPAEPSSAPASAPAAAPAAYPQTVQPPSRPPATAPEPATQPPPVTTETRTESNDGHKQMIIHNQGSPIILEFGYERR